MACFGVVRRADTFIEADGCLDLSLQDGMIENIVVGERLLDHHQVKFVKLLEVSGVGERIG